MSKDTPRRQDFIDGVPIGRNVPDGEIGKDPRALRGGNVPSVFSIAHWLRDRRLNFSPTQMTISASEYDAYSGTLPIEETGEQFDVVVVGSGMSGLAAAFYLSRRRPGTRILILDCKPAFGGNAGRDDMPPLPTPASTGGAYAVAPYAEFLHELYDAIGMEWQKFLVPPPFYSYFFDERTPFASAARRWVPDVYGDGATAMPYPPEILQDILRAKDKFIDWYSVAGGPMDPADMSDPRFSHLADISLHDYLTRELNLHPAVSDFYTRFSIDALAGTTRDVNAFTGISFLSAEYHPIFSPPGGTSAIARHLLRWLVPGSIDEAKDPLAGEIQSGQLDQPDHAVRIRQQAMVLRVDTAGTGAETIYFRDGRLFKTRARAAIIASQGYTARLLIDHLIDDVVRKAWSEFVFAPVVTANVGLRCAFPLHELGLGYDNYWWGSKYWADFVIADWCTERRFDPQRPTVLTFFGGNTLPPSEMASERVLMLNTPFSAYEQSIREDLQRIFQGADFDFDRDVTATYVYRWGHGMIFPRIGFPFSGARQIARRPVGRISFAGQDTESSPGIESAIASGLRTANEILNVI